MVIVMLSVSKVLSTLSIEFQCGNIWNSLSNSLNKISPHISFQKNHKKGNHTVISTYINFSLLFSQYLVHKYIVNSFNIACHYFSKNYYSSSSFSSCPGVIS